MRILIDTNVLLDYILRRDPYWEESREIVIACMNKKSIGCIAA